MTAIEPLGRRIDMMIRESLAMEYEDAKSAGMLGYMSRALIQATLPHSDPKESYFERTSGIITLSIMSPPKVGIPYGSVPRTLLAWISTQAVLGKSQELELGRSQSEFMAKLGMPNDGQYGKALKTQAHRLFSSMISITGSNDNELGIENVVIAKRAFLFWNARKPDERSLWESTLTLTNDFFEEVTRSPVPVDLRVLHALRQSPLAMDIYTWACYRQFLMKVKSQSIVRIPWGALQAQIGADYGGKSKIIIADEKEQQAKSNQALRNFKHNFMKRLNEVALFYPDLGEAVVDDPKFFIMRSAKLHIPPQFKGLVSV